MITANANRPNNDQQRSEEKEDDILVKLRLRD